jgi:hypothetical protein
VLALRDEPQHQLAIHAMAMRAKFRRLLEP